MIQHIHSYEDAAPTFAITPPSLAVGITALAATQAVSKPPTNSALGLGMAASPRASPDGRRPKAPSAMSQLTSPEASIAHAAAIACFELLSTEGSAHGLVLPAALKVRSASELRDPEQIEAARSLVILVVQTAHASPPADALLAGIAALARAVLTVDATLDHTDPTQAAKLRWRLMPVLEGCLLSASTLLVREQDGEMSGPQPQDDLLELALAVALHAPSLEASSHATSLLAACARERGGALHLVPLAYAPHARCIHCVPTACPLHRMCMCMCMVHGAWCMVHGAWCIMHGAFARHACACQHRRGTRRATPRRSPPPRLTPPPAAPPPPPPHR